MMSQEGSASQGRAAPSPKTPAGAGHGIGECT